MIFSRRGTVDRLLDKRESDARREKARAERAIKHGRRRCHKQIEFLESLSTWAIMCEMWRDQNDGEGEYFMLERIYLAPARFTREGYWVVITYYRNGTVHLMRDFRGRSMVNLSPDERYMWNDLKRIKPEQILGAADYTSYMRGAGEGKATAILKSQSDRK